MPKIIYGKTVLTDNIGAEYVEADSGDNFAILNIDRNELLDYLIPCLKVKKHVTRLLPVAKEWFLVNVGPFNAISDEEICRAYVTKGLGTNAPLDYLSFRIFAEEKGLSLTINKIENENEGTIVTVDSYQPNRSGENFSILLKDNSFTNFSKLTSAFVFENEQKKQLNMGMSLLDFDCEGIDAADTKIVEEKRVVAAKIAERSKNDELVSVPFNMEFFASELYDKESAPIKIGQLTKEQMLLLKKANELLPKKVFKAGQEEKTDYKSFEEKIDLDLPEWKPLKDVAQLFQKAIGVNGGKPMYFKTGPYSPKHVHRENNPNPCNMFASGIEAVKLMCCDHRIYKANTAFLDAKSHIDEKYLENGAYPLTLFVSKVNPEITGRFELRHFLKPIGNKFVLHTTAYQHHSITSYNLPRDHWLGQMYNRRAIEFLTRNKDYLLTLEMLKIATNLDKYMSGNTLTITKAYLLVLAANFDMCHRLELQKDFFIEQNPFEALTDTNRFTSAELAEMDNETFAGDGLIVPGAVRVTKLDLERLEDHLGKAAVEEMERDWKHNRDSGASGDAKNDPVKSTKASASKGNSGPRLFDGSMEILPIQNNVSAAVAAAANFEFPSFS